MTTTISSTLDPLLDLGFTEIEALVYTHLLQGSPATGYRISHAIGKPTANTYKAIASLESRGAILVDDGESRLCRAVPPDELIARLERGFKRHADRARESLKEFEPDRSDDRVYQLRTVDQVLERARAMLDRACRMALVDAFPGVLARLVPELEATAARGVRVIAKIYAPASMNGVETVCPLDADRIRDTWPGEQLNLAVDADEHLLALLRRELDGVHQAIWSNSTFLSCMQHNHLSSEIALTGLTAGGAIALPFADTLLTESGVPGLKRLLSRFGERWPDPEAS